ncbi:MAG TPA: hypothetical protein VJK54_08025 [Chthoniobacterales bacterium]|nr:hypothetical protein [Chthoniobacterales bacterium]
MKTLILTAWTDNIDWMVQFTSLSKNAYAERHGYEYQGCRFDYHPSQHPSWRKLVLIADLMPQFDRLLWIDADAFITNPSISLDQIPYVDGLTVSRDWGVDAGLFDFSAGIMIVTRKAMPLLELALTKREWENRPLWDQNALREASKSFSSLLRILPRRILNAVPQELLPWAMEPWQEGDFLCHLTNSSDSDRRAFLEKKFL